MILKDFKFFQFFQFQFWKNHVSELKLRFHPPTTLPTRAGLVDLVAVVFLAAVLSSGVDFLLVTAIVVA